jgi:magnesium transporter
VRGDPDPLDVPSGIPSGIIARVHPATTTDRLPDNVDLMVLDASSRLREDVSPGELPGYLADENALVWCDVYSTQGGQHGPYGTLLRQVFGFDELTVEDCFTRSHLPKVDIYDDYLFVALFSFHLSEKTRRVQSVEVDMYVGENYVVCVHPRPLRELDRVRRRLISGDRFVASSPANVAHTVFDAVVDEYLPIMNRLSAMVDGIEEELLSDEGNDEPEDVLGTLFHLKHELTALRRLAVPLREVVAVLMRPTTRLVPEESRMHYDDVRDHLIRVVDMIDTMRDYLAGSLDIYTTQQTQRINQSLQRLTAISTVILPLTFITSVYGMNFQNMPELATRYGYFVVLAALATLGAAMLYYLHRKKML